MSRDDDPRVRFGRVLAAISIVLGLSGVVAVVAVGRWDWLINDFIAHNAVLAVGLGLLGWVVLSAQPRNGAVWALTWSAFFASIYVAADAAGLLLARSSIADLSWDVAQDLSYSELPRSAAIAASPGAWSWIPAFFLILTPGLLLFPDGSAPGPRWRPVGRFSVAAIAVVSVAQAWQFHPRSTINPGASFEEYPGVAGNVVEYGFFLILFASALSITALVVRSRRSSGDVRRQIRVIAMGGATLIGALALGGIMEAVSTDVGSLFDYLALVGVGVLISSFAIAILKYRLYDVDVVISRTLTYLTLAGFIAAVYVGLVVGISGLIGGRSSFGLSIAASASVAIAFQPMRRRVERWANRLIYGQRATPYEVLVRFSRRSAELSDEELLTRVPRLVVDGTGATTASLWTRTPEGFRAAASWPDEPDARCLDGQRSFNDPSADYSTSVVHDGEVLGGISLVKAAGDRLTPLEAALLTDLASGLGLALRNARLTGQLRRQVLELEASRERVLAAADDARRTLENDLDSGPQQDLVAIKVKLGPTRKRAEQLGAPKLSALLSQLEADAGDAIKAVRDFAGGIYPPLLEAEGLAAAITQQAQKSSLSIVVNADGLRRYPRDVEAATYFAVLEALQNTAKYAHADSATVYLQGSPDSLTFEVRDDGRGYDPATTANGAGLTGMADRLDTVGGDLRIDSAPGQGTAVFGSIPVLISA